MAKEENMKLTQIFSCFAACLPGMIIASSVLIGCTHTPRLLSKSAGVVSNSNRDYRTVTFLIKLENGELATYITSDAEEIVKGLQGINVLVEHDNEGHISKIKKWSMEKIKLEPELY